jgi:hypothetical protein
MGISKLFKIWNMPIIENRCINSPLDILYRDRKGHKIVNSVHITGDNDSYNLNIFQLNGTVKILTHYALITEITNLSNMTDAYLDLWDGTVSIPFTSNSLDLSGVPVGTFFIKDQDATEPYSICIADQCRVHEMKDDKIEEAWITQKNGVDTFIRLNFTTNTILDFWVDMYIIYENINNSSLTLVT